MELADTIGHTQLIDLTLLLTQEGLTVKDKDVLSKGANLLENISCVDSMQHLAFIPDVSILAKCEYLNPTGSIKDRIVDYMVQQAEKKGYLKKGDTIIESTSGNTGAAVAMVAAMRGYKALLVIPDRVSQEKQAILRALGAEVRVVPSNVTIDSPQHYINTAKSIATLLPSSFYLNQYHSLDNSAAHYYTTGPEIWEQTQGNIDVFLTVAGSGGTISGIGRYLKEKNSDIKVIALDPIKSVYRSAFQKSRLPDTVQRSSSLVEGAGSDQLTAVMDFSVIDNIFSFHDYDAFQTARWFAQKTGILVGGSSGANLWAAIQIAKKATQPTRIVTLFPDSGMKYLSKFYSDHWMESQGFDTC